MRLLVAGLLFSPWVFAAPMGLVDLYESAVETSPSLLISRENLSAAEFDRQAAQAAFRPSLSLAGSYGHSQVHDSSRGAAFEQASETANGSVNAEWVIYSGSARAGVQSAQAGIAINQAAQLSTEQGLAFSVADAYLGVLTAQAQLKAAQAQLKAVERQLEQAQQRFEVGLGTRVTVDQTQAAADNQRVALIRSQDALAQAQDRLEEITGVATNSLKDLSDNWQAPVARADLDTLVMQALGSSPRLETLKAQVELAEAQLASARAGYQPTLALSATASQAERQDLSNNTTDASSTVSLNFSQPIFTGGGTTARVRSAEAKLSAAQAQLDEARREIMTQTRTLHRSIETQAATIEAQRQSIRSAESALEASQAAFDVGSGDIVDVLNAQSGLFGAQASFQTARYDALRVALQVEQLVGDLDLADLQVIDEALVN